MNRLLFLVLLVLAPRIALADIAPECQGIPKPDNYDEQRQQDFLQDYPALTLTFSPLHGPIPHEPGHGMVGMDFAMIPPLKCAHRYVVDWAKTENTNVTPVAPKLHASFAFPELPGGLRVYAGLGYIPPLTIFGQRSVLLSGEVGIGRKLDNIPLELGGRFHATSVKLIADVAKAFDERRDPSILDLYVASTFGVDLMAGWDFGPITPYLAIGYTDVSTFFYVGDDGVVTNNLHPYAGISFAAGLDGLIWKHLRWSAEFYGAPGGYSMPDKLAPTVGTPASYGHLYTARARLGYEF